MSITDQSLKGDVIKKMIAEQLASIQEDLQKKEDAQKKLTQIEIEIELKEQNITQLKNNLAELGDKYKEQKEVYHFSNENLSLSLQSTFNFIKNLDNPNGIPAKIIIEKYASKGITCHPRQVFDHINQLLKDNSIYQTNPDQSRGRKYRLTSKNN